MAFLTPDEEALFRAKLAAPTTNPSTTGQALADKLRDPTSGLSQEGARLGRVMTAPGALALTGPVPMGTHYAADALAKKIAGVDPNKPYEAPKAPEKTVPADWTLGSPLKEMPTDPAAVKAAMTLDPKYAGIAARAGGGIGGASGANPLKLQLDDARRRQLGAVGAERAFVEDLGEAKVNRIGQQSELDQQEAARQLQAAEEQRQIDEAAHSKMQGYLERNQKRADEIGAMKVDPHRLMRDATAGQQVAMAIGGMLGGALAAGQGPGAVNQFQAHLDKAIDRDIDAQIKAIENKKTALSEHRSIFGQMLQETGDARQAANEYRAQIYRSAQMSLKARADALGIPEAQANAALASNAIQQKLSGMEVQNTEAAWKQYQAQAAAAAAAQKAAADEAWKRTMQIEELKLKAGQLRVDEIKAGKEGGKEDQAAINEATKRLNEDAIVGTDPVLKSMESHRRPDGSIVGFDTASRAKVGALKGITANLLPENVYSKLALSGEERTSRLDLERLAKMYQHEVTGAGGSKEEMEDIRRAFAGVHDEASLNHAINLARKTVDTRKANATAVLSDDQKRELARRQTRDGQKAEMPTSVRAK